MTKIISLTTSILLTGILLSSCNNPSDSKVESKETVEMTETEKETAKKEISSVNAEVIKSVNELNVEAALKGYSTDVKGVNADGTSFD